MLNSMKLISNNNRQQSEDCAQTAPPKIWCGFLVPNLDAFMIPLPWLLAPGLSSGIFEMGQQHYDIKRVFHPISISSPRDFNASWNEQVLGLSLEWRLLGFITDHYDRGHWLFTRRTAGNQRNHWRRNSLPPRSTRTSPSNLFPVMQPLFGPRMVV